MIPTGTYRLQLHRDFGFRAAAGVCDYLADLGVSHVYCSPVLQASPGSAHGYDVVDPSRLSDDLGGEAGWAELVAACRRAGLGLVVDLVPNHMAIPVPESLNAPWWAVLRDGPSSSYAEWFDIDWTRHDGRVLLPVLGQSLHDVLAAGELTVEDGELRYFDHRFPLREGSESEDLQAVLAHQHYRLAHWRIGNHELNYRRFFDVTTLTGVRVERPQVFHATHERVLRMVADGEVDGLRIDHPDGLADPGAYLERIAATAEHSPWVVVEKILGPDESLPRSWRCSGTTGYDALNAVQRLLVDPAGEQPLTDLYASLTGDSRDFEAVAAESKRFVVERILHAEVARLARAAAAVAAERGWDLSEYGLSEALTEVLVAYPVYRGYVQEARDEAVERMNSAVAAALSHRPDRRAEVEAVAFLAVDGPADFAVRFAQTTGPVMAKGVEDTAFYRWLRFVALNEVGGDPGRFAITPGDFHAFCRRLADTWPSTMTALSTHDTKRSEDVRARLTALAELPAEWSDAVTSWRAAHSFGDPRTEYLLWQTLVGAWPLSRERAAAYLEKATREAKLRTSWTDPDPEYDAALQRFLNEVYADAEVMTAVGEFVTGHLLVAGRVNSLSAKLVQLTMPGVPDTYQGTEAWDLSLVDPDNRRPVDFPERRRGSDGPLPALAEDEFGLTKLLVTQRSLQLRRRRPEWFGGHASYEPLTADGPAAGHAVAFRRGGNVISLATRLPVGLSRGGGWRETTLTLPPGTWREAFTDRLMSGTIEVSEVFAALPVALLGRDDG